MTHTSILLELPEHLLRALDAYIKEHPGLTRESAIAAALSLYLMQNGQGGAEVDRIYLDTLLNTNGGF